MQALYDDDFYRYHENGSLRSAREAVPFVLELFPVSSVLDVGCGAGSWLRAFADLGIADITGLDGDYVNRDLLLIPNGSFKAVDLGHGFNLQRRYDLALSLEVAEHLPKSCARAFVRSLTLAAPIVLFSAAIPYQGGVGHVNEQWQDYWRALFVASDYHPVDCIRPRIRGNRNVGYWYQQNTIVYCSSEILASRSDLAAVPESVSLNLVHQDLYQATFRPQRLLRALPRALSQAASKRIMRVFR